MKQITPELMVDNMEETIQFYTELLNFKKEIVVPEENPLFVSLRNADVEIMLYSREAFSKEIPKLKNMKLGGSFVLYIQVDDINTLYESVKEKVTVIQELYNTDYGSMEFSMEDNNGYVLMFTQR